MVKCIIYYDCYFCIKHVTVITKNVDIIMYLRMVFLQQVVSVLESAK